MIVTFVIKTSNLQSNDFCGIFPSELVSLDLTECWPPDEEMETLENMKAFRIHRDEDVFSLNNNNIRLEKHTNKE